MSDILKALRHAATMCEGDYIPTGAGEAPMSGLLLSAAGEIERLRKAVRDQAGVELSEENDRLIEENERLRAEKAETEREWSAVCEEREYPLRAEIERLQADRDNWRRRGRTWRGGPRKKKVA